MAYGGKTNNPAALIPAQMGGVMIEPAVITYDDGGAAPWADLKTADANAGDPGGLNNDQVKFLVAARMGMGKTWAQAVAALQAAYPSARSLSAGTINAWQNEVERISRLNPPLYSDTQAHTLGTPGSLLDFGNPQETGILGQGMGI